MQDLFQIAAGDALAARDIGGAYRRGADVIGDIDYRLDGDLKVDAAAYINGMAEVIGELRRYILDALRRDAIDGCEEYMDIMDEMYSVLVTIDFPEGVTSGLRRNTDAMRGVLERTRGDLTMALRQHSLEARLSEWENNRSGS